jgi:hypothetical protein
MSEQEKELTLEDLKRTLDAVFNSVDLYNKLLMKYYSDASRNKIVERALRFVALARMCLMMAAEELDKEGSKA